MDKKNKNIVWILLAVAVVSLAFKYIKKKKGSVEVKNLDPGEFPVPGKNYFPSDVPDYQN
jgi:hypothetical protein